MGSPEPISIARDISIIVLCFLQILAVLVVLFILWKVYGLIRLLKAKTEEYAALGSVVIERAQDTAATAKEAASTVSQAATTVKGSADFISDTVVAPVVQVVSAVAGARGFVSALFRLSTSSRTGGRR